MSGRLIRRIWLSRKEVTRKEIKGKKCKGDTKKDMLGISRKEIRQAKVEARITMSGKTDA